MTDRQAPWTEEQVRALAPDASSLAAARKLAGRWRATGAAATAVWGLCQGSGAKPYQTVVDLAGPAYKCSCPSRKFPCKHALSLLLAWSGGAVPPEETPADFAAEWLAARAAKAAAPPQAKTSNTPSPATVEQRRARVSAGLTELEVWLTDQIRTGLAQTDRSFAAYEAIAARMVDAQAPRVAEALRRLPVAVVTTEHWPELLLREYARLHLLVLAHRTLDALPEPLQASIRTQVGYPTQAEAVLAEPAVRDRWLVLGMRVSEEERLHTRRTWLRGRGTGRWAVLIEHSFGTPNFTGEVPAPGSEVDAELHFYPGSAPLRAQWGARHGAPEPFTTVPAIGGTTIDEALSAYTTALSDDPWLRAWPALLTDVVPVLDERGWQLVDAGGTALPLPAGVRPWRLIAIAGGHPVTVSGEWRADGFDPVSVFSAGEVSDLETEFPVETSPTPELAELVSVALLGTARRSIDSVHLPAAVETAVPQRSGEPAVRLLETAALQDLYLRGGRLPGAAPKPEPAVNDPRRLLPRPAADRLSRLLSDKSPFLPEWFAAAAPFDFRLPDVSCVQALSVAASDSTLRPHLLRLAGRRGRWLAARNPLWTRLIDEFPADRLGPPNTADQPDQSSGQPRSASDLLEGSATAGDNERANRPSEAGASEAERAATIREGEAERIAAVGAAGAESSKGNVGGGTGAVAGTTLAHEIWLFGTAGERKDWFAEVRRTDPAAALAALSSAWPKESGPIKAELLALLADGLNSADEALLERALDDRRGDVRRTAAGLLARLPGSAFGQRMAALLTAWVRVGADGTLKVDVPVDVSAAARRDGITDGTEAPKMRWNTTDSTVRTLHQVITAAPLSTWTTIVGATPSATAATALTLTPPARYAKAIVDGWVDATLAERDTIWARELFAHATPTEQAILRRRELFTLLDTADRIDHVLDLDAHQLTELQAILPGLDHPWPDPVADHLVRLLSERARTTARLPHAGAGAYADRALLTAASVHLPSALAPRITALADTTDDPAWHQAFHRLAHDLTDRATMLEELR
ncbi:SWIM zinc finger family protein [Nocardia mangyaensis]|uniref:SWIM zinc finger family protein n=1 Tax=Nocardia mangyaensis TaxID=2213200 RepID=UPI002676E059|nr:SWIM zinc finger family protein [Nocardia mangyaensis]MDO3645433.1 SWIM zinc finger family protein [Nocardia mangyaensis]